MDFDRCLERDLQPTSLMLNRIVNQISSAEHLHSAPYYFFKLRHLPNGYFIRQWTVHNFVRKCLENDPKVIMSALKFKGNFGIFPDVHCLNLLVDHFLKADNVKDALTSASELFLLEHLDNEISQVLALEAAIKYLEEKSSDLLLEGEDLETRRNFAAIVYMIGEHRSDHNLTLIGLSLLGKIEIDEGLPAVHENPWGPLSFEEGYLERALALLENSSSTAVSKQCVDLLTKCCPTEGDLVARVESAVEELREKNLISEDSSLTLVGISSALKSRLPALEVEDTKSLEKLAAAWQSEHEELIGCEEELLNEKAEERASYYKGIEIEAKAHAQAIVELAFYDKTLTEEEEEPADLAVYLKKNYVRGSLCELDLLERLRLKRKVHRDPIVFPPMFTGRTAFPTQQQQQAQE